MLLLNRGEQIDSIKLCCSSAASSSPIKIRTLTLTSSSDSGFQDFRGKFELRLARPLRTKTHIPRRLIISAQCARAAKVCASEKNIYYLPLLATREQIQIAIELLQLTNYLISIKSV